MSTKPESPYSDPVKPTRQERDDVAHDRNGWGCYLSLSHGRSAHWNSQTGELMYEDEEGGMVILRKRA